MSGEYLTRYIVVEIYIQPHSNEQITVEENSSLQQNKKKILV